MEGLEPKLGGLEAALLDLPLLLAGAQRAHPADLGEDLTGTGGEVHVRGARDAEAQRGGVVLGEPIRDSRTLHPPFRAVRQVYADHAEVAEALEPLLERR